MADKRYQVFVSSTYEDLKEERLESLTALLTAKCFVAGMEYFPAIDKDQFEYIKKVIDDCDFYLLILGGKYGSIPDGEEKSYTEKEFDYALEQGKKIIALLHKDPKSLPMNKCESIPEKIEKYECFRAKIKTGRLVDFWMDISDLKAKIIAAIYLAKDSFPDLVGWVRGNTPSSEDMLELLQKNIKLEGELNALKSNAALSDKKICLEALNSTISYSCALKGAESDAIPFSMLLSDAFVFMSIYLLDEIAGFELVDKIEECFAGCCKIKFDDVNQLIFTPQEIAHAVIHKCQILNIINSNKTIKRVRDGEMELTTFTLTELGRSVLLSLHLRNGQGNFF